MYILIQRQMLVGIFSTKEKMRIVVEALIKDHKETDGTPCGDFHFRYIKMNIDEPWITKGGEPCKSNVSAILGFSTMHPEQFTNKIETDWSSGIIIKL